MKTIRTILKEAILKLTEKEINSAVIDASLLLCHVLNWGRTELYMRDDEDLDDEHFKQFNALLERRLNKEPIAYILGKKEFWGLDFDITPGVLIPRPDTETLVATVMAHMQDADIEGHLVDVGVGSGALLLSLLTEYPKFKGTGVDISNTALETTQKNAKKFGLDSRITLKKGSLLDPVENGVDVIVSNPPYIKSSVVSTLMDDVKGFEPHLALDGGKDGLDCYRVLIPQAYDKLNNGGLLALEIGYDQGEAVHSLCQKPYWKNVSIIKDLSGKDRVVTAIKGN